MSGNDCETAVECWFGGYKYILASRQICKYSIHEQWDSTVTHFQIHKDDKKALHLVVTFHITKLLRLNWQNLHKMKILCSLVVLVDSQNSRVRNEVIALNLGQKTSSNFVRIQILISMWKSPTVKRAIQDSPFSTLLSTAFKGYFIYSL